MPKNTIQFIIILFSIFFLISCTDKIPVNPDYIVDIDVTSINSEIILSDIIEDDYTFISLETNDSCLIGRISKIIFTDNSIYILDSHISKKIFKFNLNGDYISTIGENGGGPGGYNNPTDFIINKKEKKIIVLDMGVRILEYDTDGNYLKSSKLIEKEYSALLFEKINGGYAFISGDRNNNLIISDDSFNMESSHFPFRNRNLNKLLICPLQNIEDSIFIYRLFLNDTIYKIENGVPMPHVFLNFQNNFSSDLFSTNITKEKFSKILKNGNSCILKLFFENTESIFIAFSCNNTVFLGFYSKKTNLLKISSYNKYLNDITFEKKSSYVIGTTKNKFIFYVHPHNLIDGVESNKEVFFQSKHFQKADSLGLLITKKSNPVLLIAKLKIN